MIRRCLALLAVLAIVPAHAADLVGAAASYTTTAEDTLLDVARHYDVGYVEIRAANPDVDPWLPGAGRVLTIPAQHILPNAPRRGIVINIPELRLYYFRPNGQVLTFPLGIGGEGKETPPGQTRVVRKLVHPTWIPTGSELQETPDLPASVPPGPDNPMGDYALYLGWSGYAIHGTNKPYSIGRRDSHGCIRMYPEDIERLFGLVTPGTPVTVVNQPVKLGRQDGQLYLEIHLDQADVDIVESGAPVPAVTAIDADEEVMMAAGDDIDRLDWYAIHLAELQRTGIPVPVIRAAGD